MRYIDLMKQTFDLPTEEFDVVNHELHFNGVPLMDIIRQYGTPLKLTYLPKIGQQIRKARQLFGEAMRAVNYQGDYLYCYCTKSSHFSFVVEAVLREQAHIETSSSYDIPIVREMHRRGLLSQDTYIICNGYKRDLYKQYITELIRDGFHNCVPILDNMEELDYYDQHLDRPCQVGIRVAADEEPNFEFYTSRLGIRYGAIVDFYKQRLHDNPKFKLKMLHFFINSGIRDTTYYWLELAKFVEMYCELKKICPDLDSIDIGGGFPIKTNIWFEYDYAYMAREVVRNVQQICQAHGVPEPHIFTEFGSYTVGESGAVIYSVLGEKLQNDKELWCMIDSSFITNLPDAWGLNQKYILMAINYWDERHRRVKLGGLTCDSMDYYNSEAHVGEVFMPKRSGDTPLYVGFFHTGAYQEALGGYGGIQHCLVPAPKHVVIDRDPEGQLTSRLFAPEQNHESMMKILG